MSIQAIADRLLGVELTPGVECDTDDKIGGKVCHPRVKMISISVFCRLHQGICQDDLSYAQWLNLCALSLTACFIDTVGTCSMLPLEDDGVVGTDLRVSSPTYV